MDREFRHAAGRAGGTSGACFAGTGGAGVRYRRWTCGSARVVEKVSPEAVEFSLHEEVEAGESLPLVVGLSIVRFERMEWAIEKLTELGVARMIPLTAQRSEKHLLQAATNGASAGEKYRASRRNNLAEARCRKFPIRCR